MKKFLVAGIMILCFSGQVLAVADTGYFGESSDYEPYLDGGNGVLNEIEMVGPEVADKIGKIGDLKGWWYPTYDEFLNGYK